MKERIWLFSMEEKQVQILKVATEEFAIHGYYKTKTETIAEKAEVSKGLVFHYFKSKKNLYKEAVILAIAELEKVFDLKEFPKTSLVELFDYSLQLKFKIAETHQFEMLLMLDVYSHLDKLPDEVKGDVLSYIEKMQANSYDMIAQIVREMPIREDVNERALVKLVLTVFNQIEAEAKIKMSGEHIIDLHFFDEQIKEASEQIKILENGFLK